MSQETKRPQTNAFEVPADLYRSRRPFRFVVSTILLLCVVMAAIHLKHCVEDEVSPRFEYRQQIDHGEGLMLGLWRMSSLGQDLYQPIEDMPWVVNNYPPIFVNLMSAYAHGPTEALFFGRRVSFWSLFWSMAMIALVVMGARRGGVGLPTAIDFLCGVLASLIFALLPDVLHWGSLMRVDFLGMAFSLTGLALVAMAGRRKTWPVIVAALFFLAALATKHSLAAGPLALVLGCLVHRRRRAMRFSFLFALMGGILFFFGWIQTDGQLGFHLIRANRTAWSTELSFFHLSRVWHEMGWAIVFAVIGWILSLFVLLVEYSKKGRTARLVLGHYLWITALGLFLTGKSGSSSNYYLEFLSALAMTLGLFLADLVALPAIHCGVRRMIRMPFLIIVFAASCMMIVDVPHVPFDVVVRPKRILPNATAEAGLALVEEELAKVQGPILSQDMSLVIFAGKDLLYHPFLMPDLARRGLWFDDQLIQMIEDKEFPAIILSFDLDNKQRRERELRAFGAMFTASTLRAIRHAYKVERVLPLLPTQERLVIYRPKM